MPDSALLTFIAGHTRGKQRGVERSTWPQVGAEHAKMAERLGECSQKWQFLFCGYADVQWL